MTVWGVHSRMIHYAEVLIKSWCHIYEGYVEDRAGKLFSDFSFTTEVGRAAGRDVVRGFVSDEETDGSGNCFDVLVGIWTGSFALSLPLNQPS